MSKIVEKVVAQVLSHYYEKYSKLHSGQMGDQRERSAIDAVATLVYVVHESSKEKSLVTALFMDIKGAFDHVSK